MDRMLERLKVLVVDDNHHMINIIKTILRGFEVKDFFDASNAADAFSLIRTTPFDLIITDYAMDPINGCEFTKLIRTAEDSPNHFVPIIMLTAYAEKSKVEAARDAGVTEFCAKPVTATELYRKVCTVINTPRSFIRTSVYFGPDRRRRKDDHYKGKERRENLFGPKGATLFPAKVQDTAA
ncbi:MAG TPA: response regulator [Hyphomonadaceae bacterium]|nr:response regulator [Hyphomonadaceae bacterium]HPN04932.1 response regulator [Hyphomonadaceae bacterium]